MKQFGVIALSSINGRAQMIDNYLQELSGQRSSFIIKTRNVRFSNGEAKVVIDESVRNKVVFIVADVSNYGETYTMFGYENRYSPDEHFQDIKRTISAIAGKAKKIIVVMPLLYQSRQHRRLMRESLDCAMALQDLENMGVDSVITFDAHDLNIQNAVSRMSFDSFFPSYDIVKSFVENETNMVDKDNMVVISPDTGAMQRAIMYASMLGLDVGMFYKRRDYTRVVDGKNPVVQHEYLGRNIENKYLLIVDDMIASGASVLDIAYELKQKGAHAAFVIVTFAFFTEGIEKFEKAYADGVLKKVYTTNLSYLPKEFLNKPWLEVVDVLKLLASVIYKIAQSKPISEFLETDKNLKKLLQKHDVKYSNN